MFTNLSRRYIAMTARFQSMMHHTTPTSAMSAEAAASVCARFEKDSVCLTESFFVIISIILELVLIISSKFVTAL